MSHRDTWRFVKVNTQSSDSSESYPSTLGQIEFGKMLSQEMKAIGFANVNIDSFGYVTGEVLATSTKNIPTIGFFSHMDTALEASGENVVPQLHKNYDGGTLTISSVDKLTMSPKDFPELAKCKGHDIVTASGNTLLGADNKAGIAIILTAMEHLIANPTIPHGTLKVAFTPDE